MTDEAKLRDFVARVTRRQITSGDPELDVEPPGVYVRVAVGSSRRNAVAVGKVDDVQDRSPDEVVLTVRGILAGNDGEEPRAYVSAYRHGESNPHDSVILALSDEDAAVPAARASGRTVDDHLTTLVLAVERMARNADMRADSMAHEVARSRERAHEAEQARIETFYDSQVKLIENEGWQAALRDVTPLLKPVVAGLAARAIGVRPGPPPGRPSEGPPPVTPTQDPAPALDARSEALAAIARLRELRRAHPDLTADDEIAEGITAVIMGEPEERQP